MLVQAFPSGPFETNAYLIACEKTREAAIIDPAPGSKESLLKYLKNYTPKKIIITHSHWDHIVDTSFLKSQLKIPVYIHPLDAPNLINPGSDGLPCWMAIEGVNPDGFLNENDSIQLGEETLIVIHTPGHSPGGICLWNESAGILISGDTLFKGSIGNLSFPTCNAELMWKSLERLAKLPPETIVYPGHGPSTIIAKESWLPEAKKYFGG